MSNFYLSTGTFSGAPVKQLILGGNLLVTETATSITLSAATPAGSLNYTFRGFLAPNTTYASGDVVKYNNQFWYTTVAFTSTGSFATANWVLSPNGMPVSQNFIRNTYSASGAISPNDDVALLDSTAALVMTLTVPMIDGHAIEIKRKDAAGGAHQISVVVDGKATTLSLNGPNGGECFRLRGNLARGCWEAVGLYDAGLMVTDLPALPTASTSSDTITVNRQGIDYKAPAR